MGEAREERHRALTAVAGALTPEETTAFLARTSRWRGIGGAGVADVLEHTTDYDEFLGVTEPFYEEHGTRLPHCHGTIIAMHALVILQRDLTPEAVTGLLERAGLAGPPYDPLPDLAHVLFRLRRMGGGFAPSMAEAMARLKRAGVDGTAAEIEARVRALTERAEP